LVQPIYFGLVVHPKGVTIIESRAVIMNEKNEIKLSDQLKSIQRVKVYEEISLQIKKLIDDGKLKPGDKLPPERELSEIFHVSRHSVREALRFLERSHLVNSMPGSGTFVAMNESDLNVELISNYLIKKTDKLAEIFQLRRIVEPQVAGLAAENACEDDLNQLKILLNKNKQFLEQKTINAQQFLKLDKKLHQVIAKASKNSIVPKFIERIRDLFAESRHESYQSESRMKISAKGHVDMIQAILEKNKTKATDLMEKHLVEIEAEAVRHIVTKSLPDSEEEIDE
jgi:GntR family transcriptional regulator, transcriptional repressor for pyruvate dehydrogenase complex